MTSHTLTSEAARIGPNAAIQLAHALTTARGLGAASDVFMAAGCREWIEDPPEEMIDETLAARLHEAVRIQFSAMEARAIVEDAGRRTGRYILAHRIPRPAKALLKALPPALAWPILSSAIAAHAWTFTGSGQFSARGRRIRIAHNPLAAAGEAAPSCHWHAAVFETLLRALVSPHALVRETACCAMGAPACEFEIIFKPGQVAGRP